jgi:flagellar basal body-associated protein FliL
MADDAKPGEGAEEIEVGNRGKLPMIIAAVLALLLGAGGTFGAMQMMGGDDGAEETSSSDKKSSEEGSKKVETKMTTLGTFTVNLRDSASRSLNMTIQVESELETAAKVEERMPQLRDSVILLSSDYSRTELEGIDGKLRLRDEIQARINAVLEPAQVTRVYFTAFTVQ